MLGFLLGDDDPDLNEHQIAWYNKDWDAVQKLADTYKQKPENEFFAILNAINYTKERLFVDHMDAYSKFAINSVLSKSIECMPAVDFANQYLNDVDDQMHFDYLLAAIPVGRRYPKSTKIENPIKDIFINRLLAQYYQVNEIRAKEYRVLLDKKGKLSEVLNLAKAMATPEFIKGITKNVKEQKELGKLL